MPELIHVLGSDIPHHNTTVLRFFNDVLAPTLPGPRPTFWVASSAPLPPDRHPGLDVVVHPDRPALSRALVSRAKGDRGLRFLLHGQFSPQIWRALLTGALRREQALWHIWGADLYETTPGPRARLLYLVRRLAHRRVAHVFGTLGDTAHFRRRNPRVPTSLLYFPTRMPAGGPAPRDGSPPQAPLRVVIGNSGDRSNRHLEALRAVRDQFGAATDIVIPFGYPAANDEYALQVRTAAEQLFPGKVTLLDELVDFEEYAAALAGCDLGYFLFRRQQGIGTLCLLIRSGVPFVISRDNPFAEDLTDQGVPVLLHGSHLDIGVVRESRNRLSALTWTDLSFAPQRCVSGWRDALAQAHSDAPRLRRADDPR